MRSLILLCSLLTSLVIASPTAVAFPKSEDYHGATALRPLPHPHDNPADLDNLKAVNTGTLYYQAEEGMSHSRVASNLTLIVITAFGTVHIPVFNYPAVSLDRSHYITSVTCNGDHQSWATAWTDWSHHAKFIVISGSFRERRGTPTAAHAEVIRSISPRVIRRETWREKWERLKMGLKKVKDAVITTGEKVVALVKSVITPCSWVKTPYGDGYVLLPPIKRSQALASGAPQIPGTDTKAKVKASIDGDLGIWSKKISYTGDMKISLSTRGLSFGTLHLSGDLEVAVKIKVVANAFVFLVALVATSIFHYFIPGIIFIGPGISFSTGIDYKIALKGEILAGMTSTLTAPLPVSKTNIAFNIKALQGLTDKIGGKFGLTVKTGEVKLSAAVTLAVSLDASALGFSAPPFNLWKPDPFLLGDNCNRETPGATATTIGSGGSPAKAAPAVFTQDEEDFGERRRQAAEDNSQQEPPTQVKEAQESPAPVVSNGVGNSDDNVDENADPGGDPQPTGDGASKNGMLSDDTDEASDSLDLSGIPACIIWPASELNNDTELFVAPPPDGGALSFYVGDCTKFFLATTAESDDGSIVMFSSADETQILVADGWQWRRWSISRREWRYGLDPHGVWFGSRWGLFFLGVNQFDDLQDNVPIIGEKADYCVPALLRQATGDLYKGVTVETGKGCPAAPDRSLNIYQVVFVEFNQRTLSEDE
ncbi:hypothetical protein B0H13DRAFT_2404756 [Mycena leptocephala]|nr:hypothetical protein B0H13DRAFT_2404756 [Mycena leptocephala]